MKVSKETIICFSVALGNWKYGKAPSQNTFRHKSGQRTPKGLFYLQPPAFKSIKDILKFTLLGSILATIWRYHHQSIRRDEPFHSRQLLVAVDFGSITAQYEELTRPEARMNPPAPAIGNRLDNNNFLT
jgi:hypothetical protein